MRNDLTEQTSELRAPLAEIGASKEMLDDFARDEDTGRGLSLSEPGFNELDRA